MRNLLFILITALFFSCSQSTERTPIPSNNSNKVENNKSYHKPSYKKNKKKSSTYKKLYNSGKRRR